jgi:GntR family transcriptional repressor for pyruvate dehydrogenase complex
MAIDADGLLPTRSAPTLDSFSQLERRTMVSETTRMLKRMIIDGRLQSGDRLPAERDLCEALGVSRPTLREAIRSLDAMNILNALPGAGTFVSSLRTEELLEPMQFVLALSKSNIDDLFEVRCALEPEAAALAASRASAEEIAALRRCVERTGNWREDLDDLLALDVELHHLVVQAAHNGIFTSVLASLSHLANESRTLTVRMPGVARRTADDHIRIGTAIGLGDIEGSRQAMQEHLQGLREMVKSEHAAAQTLTASHDITLVHRSKEPLRQPRPTRSGDKSNSSKEHQQ